jgi:hypothetical protein
VKAYSKFNVLVLHQMGDPRDAREAVRSLEFMFLNNRLDLNCIVHDADIPFPSKLKEIDYHLIVLGPTFLCNRYKSSTFKSTLKNYNFIKEIAACKVAMPQDEYDCSAILDNWMFDWKVDRIYSVLSSEYWNLLYPKYSKCGQIVSGYTGYISDDWIESWKNPKPHSMRKIDVSYRASKLDENFGSHGQLKWKIAQKFKDAIPDNSNLALDISWHKQDLIPGNSWHTFIEDSKFCLIVPSGSSILDPYNKIRNCVNLYKVVKKNPSFEQIERHCFPGQDNKNLFTAISPRNLEAALAETVQIGVMGDYSGLMKPMEHYIPINKDCSNIYEVLQMMKDSLLINKIKKNCKELILSEPRLRQKTIVNEIIQFAEFISHQINLQVINQDKIDIQFAKYKSKINKISYNYWKKKRILRKFKDIAIFLGMRQVKHLLSFFFKKYK